MAHEGEIKTSGTRRRLVLLGFIALCLGVSAVSGLATAPAIEGWYGMLRKPSFNPPNWVFAPVWTVLYVMIGVAGWLVWRSPQSPGRRLALALWGIQLALNFFWSPLFFGLRSPGYGLIDIVFLWFFIGGFTASAWSTVRSAAILFIPYWGWVTFATALNASIWVMNPGGVQS